MPKGTGGAPEQPLRSGTKTMHPSRTGAAAEKDVYGSVSPSALHEADSQNSGTAAEEETSGYGKGPKIHDSPYKAAYIGISK